MKIKLIRIIFIIFSVILKIYWHKTTTERNIGLIYLSLYPVTQNLFLLI
jgi:hypothetical protein